MSQTRYLTEAYNSFVTGCKSDGIWDSIKAACVMAGWDGLAGALTPLKGAAPTNTGFVAADWNRKTGLVGNGSTKYLNSNRLGTADSNNSNHLALFVSATSAGDGSYAGVGAFSVNGTTAIGTASSAPTTLYAYNRNGGFASISNGNSLAGLKAISRPSGTSFDTRASAATTTTTSGAQSGIAQNMAIFASTASDGTVGSFTNARLSFYSIGENLNLSLLDARVTRLMDDIAFIINYGLSPLAYNADAINWANRVVDAGATVSTSTFSAVNTFCNAVDAAGIRDRFARLNLFAGSSLTAALVPLYRSSAYGGSVLGGASDTNNNFVSGDYAETGVASGGLLGNGTNKYLLCGSILSSVDRANSHAMVYGSSFTSPASGDRLTIGAAGASAAGIISISHRDAASATNSRYFSANNTTSGTWAEGTTLGQGFADGCLIGTAVSATDIRIFRNGLQAGNTVTANRGTGAQTSVSCAVFAYNSNGTVSFHTAARLCGYSIGLGLSASQVSAYYSALQAFQTALGRNI